VSRILREISLIFAPHALERRSLLLRFTPLRWLRDRRHVLNPFWVETMELVSPLRAAACYENMNEALPQLWAWQSGRDVGGWVDRQGFTIFLLFPYRSSFRLTLSGRFATSGAVTSIPISVAVDRRVAYAVAIWLAIWIPAGAILVSGRTVFGEAGPFLVIALVMPVVAVLTPIVALGHSTHEPDRTRLLAFLERTIAATAPW
jgi:hypothetical protein